MCGLPKRYHSMSQFFRCFHIIMSPVFSFSLTVCTQDCNSLVASFSSIYYNSSHKYIS